VRVITLHGTAGIEGSHSTFDHSSDVPTSPGTLLERSTMYKREEHISPCTDIFATSDLDIGGLQAKSGEGQRITRQWDGYEGKPL